MLDPDISYFGQTVGRGGGRQFGIRQADRRFHMMLLGRTGAGKSSLIELLARGDLAAGRGFALLDPHGDLADRVWRATAGEARERVHYLDAADLSQPYGYNPLRRVRADRIPLAASGLLETLRKLWPEAWGVRMEHVLRNTLYALLEREGSTLPDILRLYRDPVFRVQVSARLENQVVRAFWREEFERATPARQAELTGPIVNKVGALLSDPRLLRILAAPPIDLRFRSLMDEGRSLIVNLAKGQIGEDSAATLGSMLVSTLGLAALSRADLPPASRRPFTLYVDEFPTFTTQALAGMLAELRKTGLALVLAAQHLAQIEPATRHAVLGNVGTLIAFRLGVEDAPLVAREFVSTFSAEDLVSLPHRHFYLKLMIDGTPSRPFSAYTLDSSREPSMERLAPYI
ncbi:type IV secretion system DNA-binding domain-containing protein [Caulobacter segnis]|uniref:type IV secretory system conjugative DNA transfer family protein n=1 Tax=Caulobacter segnis TaxID=88688 RepID=UPI00285F0EC6|nr:type IV secretion system DNA-binding domain-containing protein [Caulobacter segnis]MDR6624846.1 hypothetical protein [Caulobacter segnis]